MDYDQNQNPYQSPEQPAAAEEFSPQSLQLSPQSYQYLQKSAPWAVFLGILGYAGAGFCLLFGIISVLGAGVMVLTGSLSGDPASDIFVVAAGILYILAGLVCFFPARFLHVYGSRLRKHSRSSDPDQMDASLKGLKSFFKFYGILMIVYLAFIPVFLVITIIAAVSSAGL